MKKTSKVNKESAQNYVNILGIDILSSSLPHLLTGIRDNVSHSSEIGPRSRKLTILTPNPELVLAAQKNSELRTALESATYSVPDGTGLKYASLFLYGRSLTIIPGRILFEKLIELANKKSWKVFFLGGWANEAVKAAENLQKNYKSITIECFAGPKLNKHAEPATESDKVLQKEAFGLINKFSPELLFVAFGNPKQEIWIYKNLRYLDIGGAMAVGGTFRYIAGMSKLPPIWMEQAGLEWLWRLLTEPKRLGRVINASIIFPVRIIWYKVSGR